MRISPARDHFVELPRMRHTARADEAIAAVQSSMNLRWLWSDYGPPELGLTAGQRRQVRKRARSTGGLNWPVVCTQIVIAVMPLLSFGMIRWMGKTPQSSRSIGLGSAFVAIALIMWV